MEINFDYSIIFKSAILNWECKHSGSTNISCEECAQIINDLKKHTNKTLK